MSWRIHIFRMRSRSTSPARSRSTNSWPTSSSSSRCPRARPVRQLRHCFGPLLPFCTCFSALCQPTYGMWHSLLSVLCLLGADRSDVLPIHVFRKDPAEGAPPEGGSRPCRRSQGRLRHARLLPRSLSYKTARVMRLRDTLGVHQKWGSFGALRWVSVPVQDAIVQSPS